MENEKEVLCIDPITNEFFKVKQSRIQEVEAELFAKMFDDMKNTFDQIYRK